MTPSAFLLAFDTGMAPAVGAQVTFFGANDADPPAVTRMDTLEARFVANDCDLIAKGRVGGMAVEDAFIRGFLPCVAWAVRRSHC